MNIKSLDKYLLYITLSVIFIIPIVPLVVVKSSFFPFITGKNFLFRSLVEIGLAAYLLRMLINTDIRPKKSWILIFYSLFFIAISISTIFSVNPLKSFWSNFERMEGLISHIHLFGYFLLLTGTMLNQSLWKKLLNTSLVVSVFVSIYSIFQITGSIKIFQSTERVEATFGNATYLAVYLLFNIFIAAFLLLNREKQTLYSKFIYFLKKRVFKKQDPSLSQEAKLEKGEIFLEEIFYLAVIVLNTIILFFTETRGAIIGLVFGIISIAIFQTLFNKGSARKFGVLTLTFLIAISGLFFIFKDSDFFKENRLTRRFSSISLEDSSVKARLTVWGMAYEGFKERPILGWGMENFNLVFNKYYEPKLYDQEAWFDRAHNVFFDWLISAGIVGLLLYLSLFISALYYLLFKESDHISLNGRIVLAGLLVAYFIQNIFVFDNIVSYIMFFTILGYIHFSYKEEWKSEKLKNFLNKKTESSEKIVIYSAIITALLVGSLYYANIKPFLSSRNLITGLSKIDQKQGLSKNIEIMESVIDGGYLGKQEAAEQYLQLAFNISRSNNFPEEDKKNLINSAIKKMQEVINLNPQDARPKLFLGVFFNRIQNFDLALKYLSEAEKLSPKKQAIQMEIVNALIAKGELKKAYEKAKAMYELEEKNKNAAVTYAITAILNNEQDLAEELFLKHFGTTILPDERIANAYLLAGNKERAIQIFEEIKKQNPNFSEAIDKIINQIK